ncbi:cuticlin-1-like [Paramacrobiotus metropolitanus]|uniref:cuticlin-1-like n=1 Tax=Paramacrobiotus metropolitanus TaxID=2943436 RepID=UPI002445A330|nr:cuticlin-1-like [Paramacrobiotus metropolitanus]XP_055338195.1 cuticlin-1-like [Paramacrobiotus metropolitanus]XP_055338196.1 cuticlin-1-like [Paramacrobiotus metropolitanus]
MEPFVQNKISLLSPFFLIVLHFLSETVSLSMDEMGNQIQGVDVECSPVEIRLHIRTTQPYTGRVYPKGLGRSICEKVYDTNSTSETNSNETASLYALPLTSCNTVLQDVSTGLEYQNTIIIQLHRSLVTQGDRVYNVRCRYESFNTTITATLNMSDSVPAMQLESRADLPVVSMSIYKGSSESRVMADFVTIGDPVALVINLPQQKIYGMLIKDCYVKDGVDMGGVQPLIDSEGCPVDSTLFGGFIYSADLTQAYVIFRAHKFPYTDSLFYQCAVKFCLKIGGDCRKLPTPPVCNLGGRHKRNVEDDIIPGENKTIAIVRSMNVREPKDYLNEDNDVTSQGYAPVNGNQWCVPKSAFAIILAVAGFLIVLSATILVAMLLHRRKRHSKKGQSWSDAYSSVYLSHHYGGDAKYSNR